jgi:hypothetical protein
MFVKYTKRCQCYEHGGLYTRPAGGLMAVGRVHWPGIQDSGGGKRKEREEG